ncbi:MAG: Lacal_2735 family protein [Bacteroidetes bacterium]|jgi:hypothetical protein|nr:Lacal_2735 family protein [Bacteroidota bacterium]
MFNLLKGNPKKKLHKNYTKLMKEAYKLSHTNRKLSDEKYAEAEAILKRLESLRNE